MSLPLYDTSEMCRYRMTTEFLQKQREALYMYQLDLKTMVFLLQAHAHTGLLRAQLPTGVVEQRDAHAVTLTVVKGLLVSCAITDKESFPSITGDQALNALTHVGPLNWTLTLQLSSSLLPPLSSQASGRSRNAIPRRLVEPQAAHLRALTRTQRLVFSLIDGKNSVTYIAYLLALSLTRVEQAIRELYQMKFLTLDPPSPPHMSSHTQTQHLWQQGGY